VHIRHFDDGSLGSEPLGAFEAAIRDAVAAASAKRCALLVASDRRLTLHLIQDVARRIGCRLARRATIQLSMERTRARCCCKMCFCSREDTCSSGVGGRR
jgi:hypothetical protein